MCVCVGYWCMETMRRGRVDYEERAWRCVIMLMVRQTWKWSEKLICLDPLCVCMCATLCFTSTTTHSLRSFILPHMTRFNCINMLPETLFMHDTINYNLDFGNLFISFYCPSKLYLTGCWSLGKLKGRWFLPVMPRSRSFTRNTVVVRFLTQFGEISGPPIRQVTTSPFKTVSA